MLADYVKAEQTGRDVSECYPYYKQCPKSIFKGSGLSSMKPNDFVTLNSGQSM
jgi:hypothetical protein